MNKGNEDKYVKLKKVQKSRFGGVCSECLDQAMNESEHDGDGEGDE